MIEVEQSQDYVRIFDTTLRDGEQAPGCTMGAQEKVRMAAVIADLGVSVIEAGFAAARAGEPEAIRAVVAAVGRESNSPVILSLARTRRDDIDMALAAVKDAAHPGIHLFIATSELHLREKLVIPFEEALSQMVEAVEYAKQFVGHIEVSAEDATRTSPDRLVEFYKALIRAGATVCNVPDTTGYATVDDYRALFRNLLQQARVCACNKRRPCHHVTWSAHVHDDLGLAVAKSLAAVQGGARQVECTLLGIGERCGNTALEEVVMALDTRQDRFGIATHVHTTGLWRACQELSQTIGFPIPMNKPVVGANAFAHEAGIHQDGVLANRATYEIMSPARIGRPIDELVLGKHSGRKGINDRLRALGVDLDGVDMNLVLERFKALAEAKRGSHGIDDAELLALLVGPSDCERFVLRSAFGSTALNSAHRSPTAHVFLVVNGQEHDLERDGDGIIDAAFAAVQDITHLDPQLLDFQLRTIGRATDAMGQAVVVLKLDGTVVRGVGVHTDVTMAALEAYVSGLNKLERLREFRATNGQVTEPTP
ncbi:MAG: 2-isopropylmalate synthase [Patescibacteria group bacterium]